MARLNANQWGEIRAKREGTGVSFSKLAKEYGVSHVAISKRAAAEKWQDGTDGNAIANKLAMEKVTGIVTAGNYKRRAESIEAAADIKAGVIQSQQADWAVHRDTFGPSTLEEFDRLKCAKISAEMMKIRHEGERKAYGIAEVVEETESAGDGVLDWGN